METDFKFLERDGIWLLGGEVFGGEGNKLHVFSNRTGLNVGEIEALNKWPNEKRIMQMALEVSTRLLTSTTWPR